MKLCHCGHPIILALVPEEEGQPEPTECACCRRGVRTWSACPVAGCYIRGPHSHQATTGEPCAKS